MSAKSLIYSINRSGPSTLLCGMPQITEYQSENFPSTLTLYFLPNRKALIPWENHEIVSCSAVFCEALYQMLFQNQYKLHCFDPVLSITQAWS